MNTNISSQRFDKIASNFATSEVHATSPTIKRLHELIGEQKLESVCDVACGAGHLALSFAGDAQRIVGVDPAPNMLHAFQHLAAERGVNVEAAQAPAEDLPFLDATFDIVVSRLAPHHFRDIRQAVIEMARIAKYGDVVAVIDLEGDADPAVDAFNHGLEMLHDPTHVRSYTAAEWRSFFHGAGLRIDVVEGKLSERPGGLPVKRWCEIAASGDEAETEIRKQLEEAEPSVLEALDIREHESEFLLPIRTVLIQGRKPL